MPTHRTTHRVAHTADEMFELVADVEKYPQFVPLCESLKVRGRRALKDGRELLLTDMTVGYKLFRDTFTSRVTLDRAARTIDVAYVDGPFSHLTNTWHFVPDGGTGCRVEFFIDWEMKSRMLAMAAGAVFERAFGKFSDAFEARADQIYRPA